MKKIITVLLFASLCILPVSAFAVLGDNTHLTAQNCDELMTDVASDLTTALDHILSDVELTSELNASLNALATQADSLDTGDNTASAEEYELEICRAAIAAFEQSQQSGPSSDQNQLVRPNTDVADI